VEQAKRNSRSAVFESGVEQLKRNSRSAVFESGVEQLKRNSPARFVLLNVNNTETSPLAHTRPSY
jgi:hypothetical protein